MKPSFTQNQNASQNLTFLLETLSCCKRRRPSTNKHNESSVTTVTQ
jgi:hypothetical protein